MGDPGRADVTEQVQSPSAGKFSLAQGRSFFLFYSGLQLVDVAHPYQREQSAYSESTKLNVNLSLKHSHRNIWNNV